MFIVVVLKKNAYYTIGINITKGINTKNEGINAWVGTATA